MPDVLPEVAAKFGFRHGNRPSTSELPRTIGIPLIICLIAHRQFASFFCVGREEQSALKGGALTPPAIPRPTEGMPYTTGKVSLVLDSSKISLKD